MADKKPYVMKMPTEKEVREMFALLGRDPDDDELQRYLGKAKTRRDEFVLDTGEGTELLASGESVVDS